MGYNENYIEPWCQCFVECNLPASIGQGSKVGTRSIVEDRRLLSTVFVISIYLYLRGFQKSLIVPNSILGFKHKKYVIKNLTIRVKCI